MATFNTVDATSFLRNYSYINNSTTPPYHRTYAETLGKVSVHSGIINTFQSRRIADPSAMEFTKLLPIFALTVRRILRAPPLAIAFAAV